MPDTGNCHTGGASYQIVSGVVYLGGSLDNPSENGSTEIGVLPPAARPAHYLYLTTDAEGLPYAILEIDPSGAMYLYPGAKGGNPEWFTSLGRLSYHLGS